MRANRVLMFAATAVAREGTSNASPFPTGGTISEEIDYVASLPSNDRDVKSTSMFQEPNTAIYETGFSWSYLQPSKVNVETMSAPDPKYYQVHTKKPWDLSSTEWVDMTQRKKFFMSFYYGAVIIMFWYIIPKEKNYSGLRGTDGWWTMLPKQQPEQFA